MGFTPMTATSFPPGSSPSCPTSSWTGLSAWTTSSKRLASFSLTAPSSLSSYKSVETRLSPLNLTSPSCMTKLIAIPECQITREDSENATTSTGPEISMERRKDVLRTIRTMPLPLHAIMTIPIALVNLLLLAIVNRSTLTTIAPAHPLIEASPSTIITIALDRPPLLALVLLRLLVPLLLLSRLGLSVLKSPLGKMKTAS